jgi:hypothetical protein
MPEYIAYYRASTDRQGASGLGLEAQRAAVLCHIASGQLAAEYTEGESVKRHTNRPQLLAALQDCRRKKATLVISSNAFVATPRAPALPLRSITRSGDDIWEQVTCRQHGWEYQKPPRRLVDRWARY